MRRTDGKFGSDSKIGQYFDEIVALYESGHSTQFIGKKFGIDHSNIYRGLKRRRIILRDRTTAIRISIETGIRKFKKGPECHTWKGGRSTHTNGYILLKKKNHPRTDCRGYVPEHVLVAEKNIGRYLKRHEVVHHKNYIRNDNRPENLQVMTIREHQKMHGREGAAAKHSKDKKEL